MVVLVGLVMGKTEMKCNGWSTNSNCWEENCDSTDSTDEDCYACDHYQTEDQGLLLLVGCGVASSSSMFYSSHSSHSFLPSPPECRGKGGFEYADFTSCILPDTWTSLQNCSYSTTSGEQECSKVSNDLCKDSFTGFLIAGGRTCVAEGAYSLVNGTWEGDKGEEGCEAKGGVVLGKETCALEGSWGVVFNCYGVNSGVWSGNSVGLEEEGFVVGEECWGDLKDICKEEGGAYYNQYYLIDGKAHPTTNNALLSLPACAFPSPYYAYDLCGNSSKPGVGSCDEPCEGETFNQGWGCLLEGNWGVLSEGVEEGVCLASNGTFTRGGMCLLEGRDVVMSGDVERLSAGCLEKGGVLGEGGKACALEGIYSELYCPGFVEGVGGECEFPEGVCEGEEGFLVDEGCIVQVFNLFCDL